MTEAFSVQKSSSAFVKLISVTKECHQVIHPFDLVYTYTNYGKCVEGTFGKFYDRTGVDFSCSKWTANSDGIVDVLIASLSKKSNDYTRLETHASAG